MKLNNFINVESENLDMFSKDFINNLTYYIYSYELIIFPTIKSIKKISNHPPIKKTQILILIMEKSLNY